MGRIGVSLPIGQREECLQLIETAHQQGARISVCCEFLGLSHRTLQRWKFNRGRGDRRQGPKAPPVHALNRVEKQKILEIATSPQYRDLSPWQIVPKLADLGHYVASESSFYRVLREANLLTHRGQSKPRRHSRPKPWVARMPNQVYSWDITFLKGPVPGQFYYLYLVEDIFSRKIVGTQIEETESAEKSSELIDEVCRIQGIQKNQLVLHSDNGSPMKGATMLATLQRLGVIPSFSRPAVSDDNPYVESLFKTLKYRPTYPQNAFASLEEARHWVERFVNWYNHEHLHREIRFVTPDSKHQGMDTQILKNRDAVYQKAREKSPSRWSKNTRNWSPILEVYLNPEKGKINCKDSLTLKTC